jgi:hypothetical protein
VYLGIDFLLTSGSELYVIEVNLGLPGGAHEYDLTHVVQLGVNSGIFDKIERTSQRVYGKPFRTYLYSLPFIESLKELKLWMDGMGPFPSVFHPGLRLEDKWNQYQLLKDLVRMPETMILNPSDLTLAEAFLEARGKLVLKRRVGRGGREFQIIAVPGALMGLNPQSKPYLLQEYVESRVEGFSLSIRSVAFAGEFMCMVANLSKKPNSNHGTLAYVSPSSTFGLSDKHFKTQLFNQRSWEADIWFGGKEPPYLRHNLYEEEVARAAMNLPEPIFRQIKDTSIAIERMYEKTDFSSLPKACFEV